MGAIPVHHTPTNSSGWEASKQVANLYAPGLTEAEAVKVYAWQGTGDPTKESDYRLPHHFVTNHKPGAASTEACTAGIAALNSGSTIPKADRKGVHAHLKAHLVDHGIKEADVPELKERDADLEERADKYNQADRDAAAKKGQAMPDGSYPIKDAEDLQNAIHAVGRGGADHDAIRKHIIARAKALNLMSQIPDNWNADGSMKETNAASTTKDCPTCEGTGSIRPVGSGNVECPDCGGTGTVSSESKSTHFDTVKACRAALYGNDELRSEVRTASETRTVRQMDPDCRIAQQFEMREVSNGSGGTSLRFTGYASVVERAYEVADQFGPYQETISRNAFNKTLKDGADVSFLVNHGGITMARTKPGTLMLSSDSTGLYTEATLNLSRPDVQIVRAAVEDGDLDEMSFAFRATQQEWDSDYTQREIQEVNMHQGDVSIVNYGANPATGGTVALRSKLAMADVSAAEFIAALTELRAGAAISAGNMKTLSTVLDLVQGADTNVDHALVILSNLMGVKNPDIAQDKAMDKGDPSKNTPPSTSDGNASGEPDEPAAGTRSKPRTYVELPDHTSEARQRLAAIRERTPA